jgi:hypothetical protein
MNVSTMTGGELTAVVINHLHAADPFDEFEILLRAPLAALRPPRQPRLIVMDSLDEAISATGLGEAGDDEGRASLISLLAHADDLPPWVRIFCTTRPERRVLGALSNYLTISLDSAPENSSDINVYIAHHLRNARIRDRIRQQTLMTGRDVEQYVRQLAAGNFLYVVTLLRELALGFHSLDRLDTLPRSLDEIYRKFLTRFSPHDWEERYQRIFEILSVAQEPITESQIARFTGFTRGAIRNHLKITGQFLDQTPGTQAEHTDRIYHQSFREYLVDFERNADFWCDPEAGHARIADGCSVKLSEGWQHADRYELRFLPVHLASAGRVPQMERLFGLALDESFLEAQRRRLTDEPNLPTQTVRIALECAIESTTIQSAAELMIAYAMTVRASRPRDRSPVRSFHEGTLARALQMADLWDYERMVVWYLLIAWCQKQEGASGEAIATLSALCQKNLFPLTSWRVYCAAHILVHVADTDQTSFMRLQSQILDETTRTHLIYYLVGAARFDQAKALAELLDGTQQSLDLLDQIGYQQVFLGDIDGARETFREALRFGLADIKLSFSYPCAEERRQLLEGDVNSKIARALGSGHADTDLRWLRQLRDDTTMRLQQSLHPERLEEAHVTLKEIARALARAGEHELGVALARELNQFSSMYGAIALAEVAMEVSASAGLHGSLELVREALDAAGALEEPWAAAATLGSIALLLNLHRRHEGLAAEAVQKSQTIIAGLLIRSADDPPAVQEAMIRALVVCEIERSRFAGSGSHADHLSVMQMLWLTIEQEDRRIELLIDVAATIAEAGYVDSALNFVSSIESDEMRQAARARVAAAVARGGNSGLALELITKITHSSLRDDVLAEIAANEARQLHIAAAEEAASGLRAPELAARAYSEIAASYETLGDSSAAQSILPRLAETLDFGASSLHGRELGQILLLEEFGLAYIRRGHLRAGEAFLDRADADYELLKDRYSAAKAMFQISNYIQLGSTEVERLDKIRKRGERACALLDSGQCVRAEAQFEEMQRLLSSLANTDLQVKAYDELAKVGIRLQRRKETLGMVGRGLNLKLLLIDRAHLAAAFQACSLTAQLYPEYADQIAHAIRRAGRSWSAPTVTSTAASRAG